MPSEKRQRQDEGRLARLEQQQIQQRRSQRGRQLKGIGLLLAAIVIAALAISVFSEDDKTEVSSEGTTTTVADDGETTTTAAATEPGDPAIGDTECPPVVGTAERVTTFESGPQACIDPAKTYTALVETSKGEFTVELFADQAPKTVNSFVFLARNHFFDGVAFHRIIPGFVVQGGDANGDPPGTGDPGYEFADELPTEGPPYYEIGSLAMANSGPNTNGSQFFVVTGDQGANLPASYSLFGKVIDGMDVVEAIEATGTDGGTPTEETTITKVTVAEA
jgi:peptidylprolyl isomerase/peptidyl-prolyl cis-trans isomerase B (cyclophilin B)